MKPKKYFYWNGETFVRKREAEIAIQKAIAEWLCDGDNGAIYHGPKDDPFSGEALNLSIHIKAME